MVDFNEMRKKFPPKDPGKKKRNAAIKRIAQEYEMKKAELGGIKAPALKKGIVFYIVVIMGMLMVASLILSVAGKGGKRFASKQEQDVQKSLSNLAIALGRFRYHTGDWPTDEEGLDILASDKVIKRGWNGPYIRKVVKDPWGNPYIYMRGREEDLPTLFSAGPDGKIGTPDDRMADRKLYDEPFKDISWTKDWMPRGLRGYVLAQGNHEVSDQEMKRRLEKEIADIKARNRKTIAEAEERHNVFMTSSVSEEELKKNILAMYSAPIGKKKVAILTSWSFEDKEGEAVDVIARTEGDGAELFVNNESAGMKGISPEGLIDWSVPYQAGEIKVIGYKDAHPIAEDTVRSAFRASSVKLEATKKRLGDDEFSFALATICDEDGVAVPGAQIADVEFSIEGPGELVSTISFIEEYSGLRLYGGAFRRIGASGEAIILNAKAPNLRPARQIIDWQISD